VPAQVNGNYRLGDGTMTIYRLDFYAMGCTWNIQFAGDSDGYDALCAIPAYVQELEDCLSRFKSDSDLSQLNAQAGLWCSVSDVLYENVTRAKHAARLTDGLYNPLILSALIANGYDRDFEQMPELASAFDTQPAPDWQDIELMPKTMEVKIPKGSLIDLGGIAKGWSAEQVADRLAQFGACIVSAGGDIVVRGAPPEEIGWLVEVETLGELVNLRLNSGAIMTSGIDYRHWKTQDGTVHHHIINPKNGQSSESDIQTVAVIHQDASIAEAYTKAVYIMGSEKGLYWIQNQWHSAAMVVLKDGAVLMTPNFAHYLDDVSIVPS